MGRRLLSSNDDTPQLPGRTAAFGLAAHSCQEKLNGENCKDRRPEKGHGYNEIDRMSQVRQGYPHRQTHERSRARRARRNLYFVLGLRILRKTVEDVISCQLSVFSSEPSTQQGKRCGNSSRLLLLLKTEN